MGNCIPVSPRVLESSTFFDLMDIIENFSMSENYSSVDYTDAKPCHNSYCLIFQHVAPTFLATACALAVLSNLVLLVALSKCHHVWSQPHGKALVAQLLVGSGLFTLLLPIFATSIWYGWKLGMGPCKLVHVLWHWSLFAQGLLVASGFCTAWRRWDRPSQRLAVVVWAVALLLAMPAGFTSGTVANSEVSCILRKVEILSPAYLAQLTIYLCFFLLLPVAVAVGRLAVPWLRKGWEAASWVPWIFFSLWVPYSMGLAVELLLHVQVLQPTCSTFEHFDFALGLCKALGVLHCCLGPLLLLFARLQHYQRRSRSMARAARTAPEGT
ncbi:atypical chemokine receptor 1-like [Rhea pennata]|uniref:atypical chemokine receptor 1-like n=1 Tax=Rhea pennata TaxID=8795 RepID=UPI002E25BDD0